MLGQDCLASACNHNTLQTTSSNCGGIRNPVFILLFWLRIQKLYVPCYPHVILKDTSVVPYSSTMHDTKWQQRRTTSSKALPDPLLRGSVWGTKCLTETGGRKKGSFNSVSEDGREGRLESVMQGARGYNSHGSGLSGKNLGTKPKVSITFILSDLSPPSRARVSKSPQALSEEWRTECSKTWVCLWGTLQI